MYRPVTKLAASSPSDSSTSSLSSPESAVPLSLPASTTTAGSPSFTNTKPKLNHRHFRFVSDYAYSPRSKSLSEKLSYRSPYPLRVGTRIIGSNSYSVKELDDGEGRIVNSTSSPLRAPIPLLSGIPYKQRKMRRKTGNTTDTPSKMASTPSSKTTTVSLVATESTPSVPSSPSARSRNAANDSDIPASGSSSTSKLVPTENNEPAGKRTSGRPRKLVAATPPVATPTKRPLSRLKSSTARSTSQKQGASSPEKGQQLKLTSSVWNGSNILTLGSALSNSPTPNGKKDQPIIIPDDEYEDTITVSPSVMKPPMTPSRVSSFKQRLSRAKSGPLLRAGSILDGSRFTYPLTIDDSMDEDDDAISGTEENVEAREGTMKIQKELFTFPTPPTLTPVRRPSLTDSVTTTTSSNVPSKRTFDEILKGEGKIRTPVTAKRTFEEVIAQEEEGQRRKRRQLEVLAGIDENQNDVRSVRAGGRTAEGISVTPPASAGSVRTGSKTGSLECTISSTAAAQASLAPSELTERAEEPKGSAALPVGLEATLDKIPAANQVKGSSDTRISGYRSSSGYRIQMSPTNSEEDEHEKAEGGDDLDENGGRRNMGTEKEFERGEADTDAMMRSLGPMVAPKPGQAEVQLQQQFQVEQEIAGPRKVQESSSATSLPSAPAPAPGPAPQASTAPVLPFDREPLSTHPIQPVPRLLERPVPAATEPATDTVSGDSGDSREFALTEIAKLLAAIPADKREEASKRIMASLSVLVGNQSEVVKEDEPTRKPETVSEGSKVSESVDVIEKAGTDTAMAGANVSAAGELTKGPKAESSPNHDVVMEGTAETMHATNGGLLASNANIEVLHPPEVNEEEPLADVAQGDELVLDMEVVSQVVLPEGRATVDESHESGDLPGGGNQQASPKPPSTNDHPTSPEAQEQSNDSFHSIGHEFTNLPEHSPQFLAGLHITRKDFGTAATNRPKRVTNLVSLDIPLHPPPGRKKGTIQRRNSQPTGATSPVAPGFHTHQSGTYSVSGTPGSSRKTSPTYSNTGNNNNYNAEEMLASAQSRPELISLPTCFGCYPRGGRWEPFDTISPRYCRGTYTQKPPPDVVNEILKEIGLAKGMDGDGTLTAQEKRRKLRIRGRYRLPDGLDKDMRDFIVLKKEVESESEDDEDSESEVKEDEVVEKGGRSRVDGEGDSAMGEAADVLQDLPIRKSIDAMQIDNGSMTDTDSTSSCSTIVERWTGGNVRGPKFQEGKTKGNSRSKWKSKDRDPKEHVETPRIKRKYTRKTEEEKRAIKAAREAKLMQKSRKEPAEPEPAKLPTMGLFLPTSVAPVAPITPTLASRITFPPERQTSPLKNSEGEGPVPKNVTKPRLQGRPRRVTTINTSLKTPPAPPVRTNSRGFTGRLSSGGLLPPTSPSPASPDSESRLIYSDIDAEYSSDDDVIFGHSPFDHRIAPDAQNKPGAVQSVALRIQHKAEAVKRTMGLFTPTIAPDDKRNDKFYFGRRGDPVPLYGGGGTMNIPGLGLSPPSNPISAANPTAGGIIEVKRVQEPLSEAVREIQRLIRDTGQAAALVPGKGVLESLIVEKVFWSGEREASLTQPPLGFGIDFSGSPLIKGFTCLNPITNQTYTLQFTWGFLPVRTPENRENAVSSAMIQTADEVKGEAAPSIDSEDVRETFQVHLCVSKPGRVQKKEDRKRTVFVERLRNLKQAGAAINTPWAAVAAAGRRQSYAAKGTAGGLPRPTSRAGKEVGTGSNTPQTSASNTPPFPPVELPVEDEARWERWELDALMRGLTRVYKETAGQGGAVGTGKSVRGGGKGGGRAPRIQAQNQDHGGNMLCVWLEKTILDPRLALSAVSVSTTNPVTAADTEQSTNIPTPAPVVLPPSPSRSPTTSLPIHPPRTPTASPMQTRPNFSLLAPSVQPTTTAATPTLPIPSQTNPTDDERPRIETRTFQLSSRTIQIHQPRPVPPPFSLPPPQVPAPEPRSPMQSPASSSLSVPAPAPTIAPTPPSPGLATLIQNLQSLTAFRDLILPTTPQTVPELEAQITLSQQQPAVTPLVQQQHTLVTPLQKRAQLRKAALAREMSPEPQPVDQEVYAKEVLGWDEGSRFWWEW